jgi:hypothetical protein
MVDPKFSFARMKMSQLEGRRRNFRSIGSNKMKCNERPAFVSHQKI